jgi:hypothetical protein
MHIIHACACAMRAPRYAHMCMCMCIYILCARPGTVAQVVCSRARARIERSSKWQKKILCAHIYRAYRTSRYFCFYFPWGHLVSHIALARCFGFGLGFRAALGFRSRPFAQPYTHTTSPYALPLPLRTTICIAHKTSGCDPAASNSGISDSQQRNAWLHTLESLMLSLPSRPQVMVATGGERVRAS